MFEILNSTGTDCLHCSLTNRYGNKMTYNGALWHTCKSWPRKNLLASKCGWQMVTPISRRC